MALGLAVALAGFVVGALAGHHTAGPGPADGGVWPGRVTLTLAIEVLVLAAFAILWSMSLGSDPAPAEPAASIRLILLAAATVAMGLQSGAVMAVGVSGLSTTYLTGTLVGFLRGVVRPGRPPWRSAAVLTSLVAGAAVATVLLQFAPVVAATLPAALVVVVVGVAVLLRRSSATDIERGPVSDG